MATFLATPVAITTNTGTNNVWRDVDVSAEVPSGTTGVILQVLAGGSSHSVGYRKNGSTDTMTAAITSGRHYSFIAGVDGSRIFEVVSSNVGVNYSLWLIGYTGAEAVFFDNAISYGALTSTYTDKNIASDTGGDTAVAAIISTYACYRFGARVNGSSDTLDRDDGTVTHHMIVGVDGSEIFEARGNATLYLQGYFTDGVTYHTSAVDRSTATTASYESVSGTGGATGYLWTAVSSSGTATFAIRNSGQSIDPYGIISSANAGHYSSGSSPEQKISATSVDLYERGYFTDVGGGGSSIPAISSYYRRLRG